jgi:hypothetical protein
MRLDLKSLPWTNTLAYYKHLQHTSVKSLITLALGANIIKLFSSLNYGFS